MKGKVCVVTGATAGIGLATAKALAAKGATVVVHGRNAEKGLRAVEEVQHASQGGSVSFIRADLTQLSEVRPLATEIDRRFPRIDALINNAGGTFRTRTVTTDGFEASFALNHLAPFLLTNLLLGKLKASAPARIVMVSSIVHKFAKLDLDDLTLVKRKYSSMRAYGNSKLALMLFMRTLARKLDGTGVTVNALHPGGVRTEATIATDLVSKMLAPFVAPFLKSVDEGASTSVYLATSPDIVGRSGGYYDNCKLAVPSKAALNDKAADQMWALSAELVHL